MIGRRMITVKADDHVERTRKLIELTSQSDSMLRSAALYFMGVLQSLHAVLVLIWALCARCNCNALASTFGRASSGVGVFIMALPVSYWCEVMFRERIGMPFVTLQVVWLIALALSTVLWIALRSELRCIILLSAISFLVISADAFTGAKLQLASIMGYSPYYGGRFYGLGNVGAAAALGCSLLLSCAISSILAHGLLRVLLWLALGLLTAIVVGHPSVGANFGALLSAVPSFIAGYIAVRRMKIGWGSILFVFALLLCALAVFVTVDLLRGVEGMSHLGRFIVLLRLHGFEALASMLTTKALIWWRAFKHVPFTVALFAYIVCGFVSASLLWREIKSAVASDELLAALIASFACGAFISFLVNDSGPLTPVVMLSYGWSAIWLIAVRSIGNASERSNPEEV